MPPDTNGWPEHAKYVLAELTRLNTEIILLRKDVKEIKEDTIILKMKAGLWALLGSAIPVSILLAIKWLNLG